MSTPEHVKVALAAAATFRPLSAKERKAIEAKGDGVHGGVCSECPKPCDKACANHRYLVSSYAHWFTPLAFTLDLTSLCSD